MSVSIKVLVVTVTVLSCLSEITAFKCWVCQDCESSDKYNSTHLIECKRSQNRCIKMELMNGAVDRACADNKKCSGRDGGRRTRAIIDARTEEIILDFPKRRTVRQLLQAPGSSSSSSSSNKNKDKKKQDPGSEEVKTLHCCAEEECNGNPRIHLTTWSLFAFPFLVPYFQRVWHD